MTFKMLRSSLLDFLVLLFLLKRVHNNENVQNDDYDVKDDDEDYDYDYEHYTFVKACGEDQNKVMELSENRLTPKHKDKLKYNHEIRPMITAGEPLLVEVNILVKDIIKVDTKAQSIAMEAVTVLEWFELRMYIEAWCKEDAHGKYMVLPGEWAKNIWMPDVFIDKASQIRNPIYLNDASSVRFHENSLVSFSTLLNWNTDCEMDFSFFPFDKQVCTVWMESFDWGSKHLNISWSSYLDMNNSESLELDMYDLEIRYNKTEYHYLDIPYGVLHMEIHLERKVLYYLLNLYLPSTFLITVSYCSLYLAPTSKVPRIGMTLVTLLSITTMVNEVKNNMPRVSYITMADAWLFPIIYYSFLCLFEFLLIQYLVELEMEVQAKKLECAARVVFAIIPLLWITVYAAIAYNYGYSEEVRTDSFVV